MAGCADQTDGPIIKRPGYIKLYSEDGTRIYRCYYYGDDIWKIVEQEPPR